MSSTSLLVKDRCDNDSQSYAGKANPDDSFDLGEERMSLMAFVDANSAGGDGGIMLDIEAKGEDDMETIMQFIEMMNERANGMIHKITIVNSTTFPVEKPYVHPPLAGKANPDDSFNLEEKTWFELILSVSF